MSRNFQLPPLPPRPASGSAYIVMGRLTALLALLLLAIARQAAADGGVTEPALPGHERPALRRCYAACTCPSTTRPLQPCPSALSCSAPTGANCTSACWGGRQPVCGHVPGTGLKSFTNACFAKCGGATVIAHSGECKGSAACAACNLEEAAAPVCCPGFGGVAVCLWPACDLFHQSAG